MFKAILFDIDGTLLHTGGAGAEAWQRAFRELYEVEANIEEHTHAGMTDPEIAEIVFREVIGRAADRLELSGGERSALERDALEAARALLEVGAVELR